LNNAIVDRKTLAWIKEGVEEALESVIHAPDKFLADMEDSSPIQDCIAPLHRIKGAVQMVGVSGATLLALELEYLATALANGRVKQKRDAAEVLATGMLQLPGYLESLYHGQPDIPLILLPLLNDIRACQDKQLLTEGEFFYPDLSIDPPLQPDCECLVRGDLTTVARKLRPGYLSGLLGLIQEQDVVENVEKLILVIDNLLIASTTNKAKQFWWVALGVIESLYEQGLEASIAVKILLGRVDRQIQRVIEHGEEILMQEPPDKIIKNLLYYVAQAQTYNTRVVEIKKAFNLDYPDDSLVKKARENLYGYNANLIESISTQVLEELGAIKDALDMAMRKKEGALDGLDTVLQKFSIVADALGMLGINTQKDFLNKQRQFLVDKIEKNETLNEDDFMGIASALLHIEISLADFGRAMGIYQEEGALTPVEYEKSLKLVAKEILKEIQQIKDSINDYSQASEQAQLESIPDLLSRITGAMHVLRHDLQASIGHAVGDYVSKELVSAGSEASMDKLDLLADAITGIENYYQTILEESVAPEIGLRVGAQSMAQLGYPLEEGHNKASFQHLEPNVSSVI
jgi:chemosensory pili system protein ChpA (sensor histidine kinase/response regulator)